MVRALLDLPLHEAALNGLERPAHSLDLLQVVHHAGLDLVGEGLDEATAGEGVHGVGHAAFVGDDLLGAQGDPGRGLGGQGQRLVHGVAVEGLSPSQNGGQGLNRHPHDVVLCLLSGESCTRCLGVEAEGPGARVLRPEALPHDPRPETPRRPELGRLLQEIALGREEEGETGGELVHVQAPHDGRLDVGDGVGQGEGHLLHRRGPRLADVVAADGDGIPAGKMAGAVGEEIRDQAQGRPRREDVGAPGDVLFEDVVLDRATEIVGINALLPGHGDGHGQEDRGRGVDGHGGADPIQGDTVEEPLHVLQGRDGHPHPAHLPLGQGVVRVVADLGGQIEGHGEPRLPLLQEILVATVRLLGGGVAGVLTHCPETTPVHGGVDASGKGILTGKAEVSLVVQVGRGVEPPHLDARQGLEAGIRGISDQGIGDQGISPLAP